MYAKNPFPTALYPPWVHFARALWLVMAFANIWVFVSATLDAFETPLPSCVGPDAGCPANVQLTREDAEMAARIGFTLPLLPFFMAFSVGARLSLAVVATIIFWRRSNEWVALIMSGALMSVLLEGTQGLDPTQTVIQGVLFAAGTALFLPIPFIFPSGKVEPPWLRWPMILVTAFYTLAVVFFLNSPYYWTFTGVLTLFWILFGGYAMAYRYRKVSTPIERQQTKWVLLGIGATFTVGIYYTTVNSLLPASEPSEARIVAMLINMPLYLGGYGFLAFGFLVAMLRYRLWDIDLIIRRTLQYAILTATLALAYFGAVVVLQGLFGQITGESGSPLITVISTLAIAALFTPLRTRTQDFIDRRFFRQKYNAEQILARFAAAARDEVDLEALNAALLGAVAETMQPERVSLLMKTRKTRE